MTEKASLTRVQIFVTPGAFDQAVATLEAVTDISYDRSLIDPINETPGRMAIGPVGDIRIHLVEGATPSRVRLEIHVTDLYAAADRIRAVGTDVEVVTPAVAATQVEALRISLLCPLSR